MPRDLRARKTRTRGHVIADLSVNYTERYALQCGFTVQRCQQDYGIDLEMSTFDENGEIEPGLVYFQVKATDNLQKVMREKFIAISVDERDLRGWLSQAHPVILVIYDAQQSKAFWINIQEYFRSLWSEGDANIRAFRTLRIPLANRLNVASMRKFAGEKNKMYRTSKGWFPYGQQ